VDSRDLGSKFRDSQQREGQSHRTPGSRTETLASQQR
jgi:hypothetical protein